MKKKAKKPKKAERWQSSPKLFINVTRAELRAFKRAIDAMRASLIAP